MSRSIHQSLILIGDKPASNCWHRRRNNRPSHAESANALLWVESMNGLGGEMRRFCVPSAAAAGLMAHLADDGQPIQTPCGLLDGMDYAAAGWALEVRINVAGRFAEFAADEKSSCWIFSSMFRKQH